jgi:hypothetical protein
MGWSGGGSVNIDDATLIKNTQGQIEVNLANANTWTATQTFNNILINGEQANIGNYTSSQTLPTNVKLVSANASSGAITLTLPSATGSGLQYTIIKSDSLANIVSIKPSGSDTIDGIDARVLTSQYEKASLIDIAQGLWTDLSFKWMGIQGYVPITLTNSQSTATGSNFQAYVSVNLSPFSSFINSNLSNLYFSSDIGGSQVLNSWRESGTSNTGTATYWVLLPNGIAANSNITIYLQIDNVINNDLDTTTTGVAPQLTSTYAQYDNGASVFSFYDNFAGTSLNTGKWNSYIGNGSITINNSLTINMSSSGTYAGIVSYNGYPLQLIFDTYLTSFSASSLNNPGAGIEIQSANSTSASGYIYISWNGENSNGGSIVYGSISGGDEGVAAGPNFPSSNTVISSYWLATGNEGFALNYNSFTTSTNSSVGIGSANYYALATFANSPSTTVVWQWARARAYPPNGVMPSVSVGSLTIM